ncbi:MAG: agmatine deiminase family protein [Gammaproteobacteria bacterium]|nr:agmatine deiminase family protein [Gammaproteobacteria bacterium]MDE2345513.1 agmatine deiminase family protein [Gammaproteobacteria bacterium]
MHTRNYLPPEWAPQSGIMLTWPRSDGDWNPDYASVEQCHTQLAKEISLREKVLITCMDNAHAERIRALVKAAGGMTERLHLYPLPSNDAWARDHGPITVIRNGKPVLLDFIFNGWGGKYPHSFDNQITSKLHQFGAFGATPLESLSLVLEGGSIEVDGTGTLLTTESCLLNPNRNPTMQRSQIETMLRELIGIERILWLRHGAIDGDDTDGHIDTLARFCDSSTIAFQACDDQSDPHFQELRAMQEELRALRCMDGQPYKLVPLPWPKAIFDHTGRRLPATYANFLIINGAVLVPTYNDAADANALAVFRATFTDRQVVAVMCRPLIYQYGSLHCVSMQLPEGVIPATQSA